jgi:hypothetical protein
LNALRVSVFLVVTACSSIFSIGSAHSALETTVPISAESGTGIAANLFPVSVKLSRGSLFLTDPTLLFLDETRIGMEVRVQAYDHRPNEGIAVSEMGQALLSGRLGFDPATRQFLLHEPKLDRLIFDRDNSVTQRWQTELNAAWKVQITNPIRSDIPPHPYLLPFKENIQGLSYDGSFINLKIVY